VTQLELPEVSEKAASILDEVETAVIGKRDALTMVLSGVLAGGHVLLEDFPGLGKTLAARSFAQTLGLDFARAQFTPDLLPADLTGSFIFDQRVNEFSFRPGPLFTGLLLADEINRTPPKTQAALLEAMQERQVTVEGETFHLEPPFHVLATANPVEYEGTYPLPEAQLDRFMLQVSFGYPTPDEEWDVLSRRLDRQREEQTLRSVVDAATLCAMQEAIERVTVDESVGRYCVALANSTRSHPQVLMGSSPRGSLALMLVARAFAVVNGRDFVTPEDVKAVAVPVLAHRIAVKPELWMSNASGASVVAEVLGSVPTPAALEAGISTGAPPAQPPVPESA
jgi:MoxR-like ATPase